MTVFEEIVDSIVEFFSSMMDNFACRFHNWQMRRDYVKEKKKYKDALIGSEIQYEPEEPDKHLALRVVSYLEYKFPNGIQNHLLQLSVDERKKLMNEIVEDAARLFDVEPVNFRILYPTNEEEFHIFGCGFYSKNDNLLCINGAYILNDDPAFTEEQIFTVFHELQHARQFAAMDRERDYGYSEELVNEWRYNIVVYIHSSECDEAYRKQAIERSSFGVERMIRDMYNKKMREI